MQEILWLLAQVDTGGEPMKPTFCVGVSHSKPEGVGDAGPYVIPISMGFSPSLRATLCRGKVAPTPVPPPSSTGLAPVHYASGRSGRRHVSARLAQRRRAGAPQDIVVALPGSNGHTRRRPRLGRRWPHV